MITGSPKILLQAFGLQALETNIYKGKIGEYSTDPPLYNGALNLPVFGNLYFKPIIVNGIRYDFPKLDTVLFTVTQNKHIVTTPIQGGVGDVIEYIGMGNFNINVKATICGNNMQRPIGIIKQVNKFLSYYQSLTIVSDFINNEIQYFVPDYSTTPFDPNNGRWEGVNDVVVTRYEEPQEKGGYSYQNIDFDLMSDRPVELIING